MFSESGYKKAVDCFLIAVFVVFSVVIDFKTFESRKELNIGIKRGQYITFLYVQNTWFAVSFVTNMVSRFFEKTTEPKGFLYLDLIDMVLVIKGYSAVMFMSSLNILRVIRVVLYVNIYFNFEYVREVFLLLKKSFFLVISIVGVSFVFLLFISVFLNSMMVI